MIPHHHPKPQYLIVESLQLLVRLFLLILKAPYLLSQLLNLPFDIRFGSALIDKIFDLFDESFAVNL